MLFSKADLDDHKSVDILTFMPNENDDRLEQLNDYINIISNSNDRLIGNYLNVHWKSHCAISLLLQNDNIVGFCSIWNREFYKKDTVRIFNKWWEDPYIRKISKIIGDSHLLIIADHQLQISKELGFTWAFISREKTPKYFKKVINALDEYTEYVWIMHKEKIAVCYPQSESCWQWVGYTNLKNGNDQWSMLNEKI